MNLEDLKRPFAPDRISWRLGSTTKDKSKGMALAYIDARDVQDRLDEVCGVSGWQCRYPHAHDKKTVCEIGIRIDDEWIWKADGAGDTDVEAEKGALSDAFKRAAVRWGIGRYLYDLDSPWVKLEAAGNSYKIAAQEYPRLRALLGGAHSASPNQSVSSKPKMTPAEWVERAEKQLRELHTTIEFTKWLQTYSAAIDALQDKDKALYNALNVKIMNRGHELQEAAA